MKGKNLLRLSLIMLLLIAIMIKTGLSPSARTKLYIDPKKIPKTGPNGHPGEEYCLSVKVDKVNDLWAATFVIHIAPYAAVLVPSAIEEGDFLSEGETWPTSFFYVVDMFYGEIEVTIIRLPNDTERIGVSGSGTLMTFKLTVVEAGDSPIDLLDDTLVDSNWETIDHKTIGSYYYGATADLVTVLVLPSLEVKAGENLTFRSLVLNTGDMQLYVRVCFDGVRLEDGRRIRFYAGQTYYGGGLGEPLPFEYIYCDGYYPALEMGWDNPGASLIGEPDGNFTESTTAFAVTSMYTFEDIDLAGRVIQNVDLYGYTRQPDGIANDFDPYMFTFDEIGNPVMEMVWCDSLGGSETWAWTGGRYYQGGPYDMPEYYGTHMHTQQGINSIELQIENYGDSGTRMQIDALRWKVEFATVVPLTPPTFLLEPYELKELDPATWVSKPDHIGTYVVTATLEYTSEFMRWNAGHRSQTFTISIVDP